MSADKKMRGFEKGPQLKKTFKGVIIYLDTAMPGLDELGKRRVLMVRANCHRWLYTLWQHAQKFFVVERNPLLDEGFKNIMAAIEILAREHPASRTPAHAPRTRDRLRAARPPARPGQLAT